MTQTVHGCERTQPQTPEIPPMGSLFEPVTGPRGNRLALVFGNENESGRCPFYQKQCTHCDLGAGEGIRFTPELNAARLTFFRQHYRAVLSGIDHLVIYNSGSTLNPGELSPATMSGILAFAHALPRCTRVSFDSREPFITPERIGKLVPELRDDQSLGITLGLESQDDTVREKHLAKTLTRVEIDTVFAALASFPGRTTIELNVLFQPPGIVRQAAVDEALATIDYGLVLRDRFGVPVDFNFHPYYPSWKGSLEFPEHPRALAEDAIKALILICRRLKAAGGDSRVFVGWNDEGHDLQPARKQRELLLYWPGLASFNRTQDEHDLRI